MSMPYIEGTLLNYVGSYWDFVLKFDVDEESHRDSAKYDVSFCLKHTIDGIGKSYTTSYYQIIEMPLNIGNYSFCRHDDTFMHDVVNSLIDLASYEMAEKLAEGEK